MSVCERFRGFKAQVRFCSDGQTSQPESQQPEPDGEFKTREQLQILSPPAQIPQSRWRESASFTAFQHQFIPGFTHLK